mgnify:CR=1 FL=1
MCFGLGTLSDTALIRYSSSLFIAVGKRHPVPSANLLFLNEKQIAQGISCTVEDVPLKSVDGDLRRSTKRCRGWHEQARPQ